MTHRRFACLPVATAFAASLVLSPAAFAQTAGPKKAPWEGPPCSKEKSVVEMMLPKTGTAITTKPGQPPSIFFQGRLRNLSCATGMTNIDPEGWKARFFLTNQSTKQVTSTDVVPVQNGFALFKGVIHESMLPLGANQATFRVHGEVVAPFTGPPFLGVTITVHRQLPPATFPQIGDIVVAPTIVSPTPNSLVQPNVPTSRSWPGTPPYPFFNVAVQTTLTAQQCAGAKIHVVLLGATGYSLATGPVFPPEGNAPVYHSILATANCVVGTKTAPVIVYLKPPFKAASGWVRARASQVGANGGVFGTSAPTQFKLNAHYN